MKSLKEYYRFITEEVEPEAPEDAIMGQYAFAPDRIDVPRPPEPNTPEETKIRNAIGDYISGNRKAILSDKAEELLGLVKKGYYKKVLDPSKYSTAWRVLQLQKEAFSELIGTTELKPYGIAGPGTLSKPKQLISGWTVNPDHFIDNNPGYGEGPVIAIFEASITDNTFFGNPGELAKALRLDAFVSEMETIAVGPVKYNKCSYVVMGNESGVHEVHSATALAVKNLKNNKTTLKEYYRFLVTEQEQDNEQEMTYSPEAPEDEVFGQYAFAMNRDDTPIEPNTPEENEVEDAIVAYMTRNYKGGLNNKAPELLDLVKKGYYKKVLDPSAYSVVYRLLEVPETVFEKLTHKKQNELDPIGVLGPGVLPPDDDNVSGWTANPDFLTGGSMGFGKGKVVALFEANVQDNTFFGNPGELAKAVDKPDFVVEKETIAYGPVKYNKCSYVFRGFSSGIFDHTEAVTRALENIRSSKNLQEHFEFLMLEAKKQDGEAPEDAVFGKYAFATTRQDTPTPKEPNTEAEEETRRALMIYYNKNKKGPLDNVAPTLLSLSKQGYYKKVLDPSKYSTAYRLLRLPKDVFAKIVGVDPQNIRSYGLLGPGTLNPNEGQISGWTVRPQLFTKDEFDPYGNGNVFAIFIAPIESNNFFGNPDILSKAVGEPNYLSEREIFAVGPVNYTQCTYGLQGDNEGDEHTKIRLVRMLKNAGVK